MGDLKESLKEELKEEFGDLVYEKAKAEVKTKIKDTYQSRKDRFLAFFGIRRNREQIEEISEKITAQEEGFMSQSLVGILEMYSINYFGAAIELGGTLLSDRKDETSIAEHIDVIKPSEEEPNTNEE